MNKQQEILNLLNQFFILKKTYKTIEIKVFILKQFAIITEDLIFIQNLEKHEEEFLKDDLLFTTNKTYQGKIESIFSWGKSEDSILNEIKCLKFIPKSEENNKKIKAINSMRKLSNVEQLNLNLNINFQTSGKKEKHLKTINSTLYKNYKNITFSKQKISLANNYEKTTVSYEDVINLLIEKGAAYGN